MPSAKSGSACTLVTPAAPRAAQDADKADPGEMSQIKTEQRQTQSGKYGSTPFTAHKAPQTAEEKAQKTHFIEIKLVDEENKPVPGESYKITLPDSSVAEGTLDGNGFARVDGIDPGSCQITFPKRDQEAWTPL